MVDNFNKIDIYKALNDEQYTRNIEIQHICLDDIIFIFSNIYASNINFKIFQSKIDYEWLKKELYFAQVNHCLSSFQYLNDLCDELNIPLNIKKIRSVTLGRQFTFNTIIKDVINSYFYEDGNFNKNYNKYNYIVDFIILSFYKLC